MLGGKFYELDACQLSSHMSAQTKPMFGGGGVLLLGPIPKRVSISLVTCSMGMEPWTLKYMQSELPVTVSCAPATCTTEAADKVHERRENEASAQLSRAGFVALI
jgi:hypothetical protein